MILVSVGASHLPFDRLLRAVDGLPHTERLVVQHGPSAVRPAAAECFEFLPIDELAALMRDARVVVTHGGVGSILVARSNGKRPCVVPRLRQFGESVDDHQVESARRFERAGLVTMVEDTATLAEVVAGATNDGLPSEEREAPLVRELRAYIAATVGPPMGAVA